MEALERCGDLTRAHFQRFIPTLAVPLQTLRQQYEALLSPYPVPAGVSVAQRQLNQRNILKVVPPETRQYRTLLILHGGGYILGSAQSYAGLSASLASACGCQAIVLDYALAPESSCPSILADALAAYEALLEAGHGAESIALFGDSAGGGLTMALLLRVKARGLPLPSSASLVSPWIDLACSGPSMSTMAETDPMLSRAVVESMAQAFLQGQPEPPEFEPVHADLTGLCPLLIQASDCEVLSDDALRLASHGQ